MTVFISQRENKWATAPRAETIPGLSKLNLSIMQGTSKDDMTI